mgnify:FL=1
MITKQLGDYSGEMSLMGRERRLATIAEIAELLVFEVSGTAFRYILEQQPSLLEKRGENTNRRSIKCVEAVEGARIQRLGETSSDILNRIEEFLDCDAVQRASGRIC